MAKRNAADNDLRVSRIGSFDAQTLDGVSNVLIDCTAGGASVGFMNPLSRNEARAFWQAQSNDLASGVRSMFVAFLGDRIVGTVQLIPATMPNQPHRADIAKMLVHRDARRRGVGGSLMNAAEEEARRLGKSVLVLDTASDDARRLYERHGWVRVGDVPDFALWPDGGLVETTFYYKHLKPTV